MPHTKANSHLPKLLVVDDQPINIQALHQIFHTDYQVFKATSGQGALDFCATNQPDLILLDVLMPGMDGHEVCRRLKANPLTRDIPIIFVTAQSDPYEIEEGFALGAADFITKPVHAVVVRARVQTQIKVKQQADMLRSFAYVDGLTGITNRRGFDETIDREWRRCQRSGQPLGLILIDIDFFKGYNDRYGHQEGDACLQQVAATLKAHLGRAQDLVARYGGEEFVCLMPESELSGVRAKAEELRRAVAALQIPNLASPELRHVSISLGAASLVPDSGSTPMRLLIHADKHLYNAKMQGRNRVCAD